MNLPLTAVSRAAKAFQDREDARLKEKYGTADDPGTVPVNREGSVREVSAPVEAGAHTMSAAQVQAALAAGRAVSFVDVRSKEDWQAGRIEGAVCMPMSEVGVRVSELEWDQLCVAYCGDGAQSAQAVAFFRERGMEDTWVLQGGLAAWQAAGGAIAP
jgi:rhodanese-related sulfurtransferase